MRIQKHCILPTLRLTSIFFLLLHRLIPVDSTVIEDELKCRSLQAQTFDSPSINFAGNEIANAALTNATIHGGLQHLAVHTLELQSGQADPSSGVRMAIIDPRGSLSTTPNVRWDEHHHALSIPKLRSSSHGMDLDIETDVNFHSHMLRNVQLEHGSILTNVNLEQVKIHDSILSNVTFAQDLTLGSVTVDGEMILTSMAQKQRKSDEQRSTMMNTHLLTVDENGSVQDSNLIELKGAQDDKEDPSSSIEIKGQTHFLKPVDFHRQESANVHITSGHIEGDEIDIHVRDIKADSLVLNPYKHDKKHTKDALVIIDADGLMKATSMTLHEDGWIENASFMGSVQFRNQSTIHGANLHGGTIQRVEELSVDGPTTCRGGLRVVEDVYIDGSLTVGGSVSGTGPYIDLSDVRYKTNIENIHRSDIMHRIHHLEAISYELKTKVDKDKKQEQKITRSNRQIGLIAQDVQKYFPELVSVRPDGYLGVQYARFVPLILEALKEMDDRMKQLEEENITLRKMFQELI